MNKIEQKPKSIQLTRLDFSGNMKTAASNKKKLFEKKTEQLISR